MYPGGVNFFELSPPMSHVPKAPLPVPNAPPASVVPQQATFCKWTFQPESSFARPAPHS